MRNWRTLTAIATVVLAGLAAVLVYVYIDNADQRAQEKVAQVSILTAGRSVGQGTPATGAGLVVALVPRKNVPDSYLTNVAQLGDKVAIAPIDKGALITPSMFVDRAALTSASALRAQIPAGMTAISLSVDQAHGVANLVRVGDSINIIATDDVESLGRQDKLKVKVTQFLIPNAQVLAIGSTTAAQAANATTVAANSNAETTSTTTASPQNLGLVTIALPNADALRLAHAIDGGVPLYLSLNPYDGAKPLAFDWPADEIVGAYNLFPRPLTKLDEFLAKVPDHAANG